MPESIGHIKIFKQENKVKHVVRLLTQLSDCSQWYENSWADRHNKKVTNEWSTRANDIINFIDKDVNYSKEYFTIWLSEQKPKVQYFTLELLSRFTTDRETQNGTSKKEHSPLTIDLVSDLYSSLLKNYFVVDKNKPDLVSEERRKQFADESIFFLDISPLSIEKAWNTLLNDFESNPTLINLILNSEKYTDKHFSFLLPCLKSEYERHQYIMKHKDTLLKLKAIDEKDIRIF